MAQIFHRSFNTLAKATLFGSLFLAVFVGWAWYEVVSSPYATQAFVPRDQPVQFSHEHHTRGLGIDCRYCHSSVEVSPFAGIPATKVCMTCHSQMWADSPFLAPVRDSYQNGQSIPWVRVNDLPDYVYFDHSIHVKKGMGCATCHGPVNRMQLTWRENSLHMSWCLDCHRHPERFVRPREQVFNMDYEPQEPQEMLGKRLVQEYGIRSLQSCSTCHR